MNEYRKKIEKMSVAEVERCRGIVLALGKGGGIIELKAFRAASGMGRSLAVLLLERFDAEGFTRRVEGGRVLRRKDGT